MLSREKDTISAKQFDNGYDEWLNNPYPNEADSDLSSEESQEELISLHKFMSPAHPLPEKNAYQELEAKTAFKIKFNKLPPMKLDTATKRPELSVNNLSKAENVIEDEAQAQENDSRESTPRSDRNTKTLFKLYPDGDSRLVYQKYKSNAFFDPENKLYSGLFINLQKLARGQDALLGQNLNSKHNSQSFLTNTKPNDPTSLAFDSAFESGNLLAAFRVKDNEYDLILQNDINTKGNTQWFFFSVNNTVKKTTVKFNIVNLMKPDSLFNEGMKPVVHSKRENQENSCGWKREGHSISYYKNSILRECESSSRSYYTLSFSYQFQYDNDIVYFAHCYPYTYSHLNDYLNSLVTHSDAKKYVIRKLLCETLAKNQCEYLTITSNEPMQEAEKRFGIFVSARQHPGESLSSYMMQGVIDFLTDGQDEEAKFLREQCIFKIIPMMNPDGVIHGNYRTNLSGCDLNRQWKNTTKTLFPTVFAAKSLIKQLSLIKELLMICDLHGHSRKKSSFFYGCTDEKDPTASRVLPLILSKLTNMFSFTESRFQIDKAKETTARVTQWNEYKIPNVFTLEASFYGYISENGTVHYTQNDFINIGRFLCRAMYVYISQIKLGLTNRVIEVSTISTALTDKHPEKTNSNKNSQMAYKITAEAIIGDLNNNPDLIASGAVNDDDDSGSDSNPSDDDLPPEQRAKILAKRKKLKKPSKKVSNKSLLSPSVNKKAEATSSNKKNIAAETGSRGNSMGVLQAKPGITHNSQPKLSIIQSKKPKIFSNGLIKGVIESFEVADIACQTEEVFFDIISLFEGTNPAAINTSPNTIAKAQRDHEFKIITARRRSLFEKESKHQIRAASTSPFKKKGSEDFAVALQMKMEQIHNSAVRRPSYQNSKLVSKSTSNLPDFVTLEAEASKKSHQQTMIEQKGSTKANFNYATDMDDFKMSQNLQTKIEHKEFKQDGKFVQPKVNQELKITYELIGLSQLNTSGAKVVFKKTASKRMLSEETKFMSQPLILPAPQSYSQDKESTRQPSLKTKYMNDELNWVFSDINYLQRRKPRFDILSRNEPEKIQSQSHLQKVSPTKIDMNSTIQSALKQQDNYSAEVPVAQNNSKNVLKIGRNTSMASILEQLKNTSVNIRSRSKSSEKREQDPSKFSTTALIKLTAFGNTNELLRRPNSQALIQNRNTTETAFYNNSALKNADSFVEYKTKEFEKKILRQILGPAKKGVGKDQFGLQ